MESLLDAADNDNLIPSLDYRLGGPTADYFVDRAESTFFSSVVSASPTGVKVVTWNVNNDHWIYLASLHFSFTVKNNDPNHPLLPLWPTPSVLFDRMLSP